MNNKKRAMKMAAVGLLMASSHFAAAEGFMTHRYDLPTGQLVSLKGNVFTTKTIHCVVRAAGTNNNALSIVSLHNQNIINGLILTEGNQTTLNVRIGNNIDLEMEKNSELGIMNLGNDLVNIECS